MIIPVSIIIPTANRHLVLKKTLYSIREQTIQPEEIIIIDASDGETTKEICTIFSATTNKLTYIEAKEKGAAKQRMQGIRRSGLPFIFFMDDDIILEQGCIGKIWDCLHDHPEAAAANAMITNQQYYNPGKATKFMYRLMSGQKLNSYAGKCIGPAWNLLPQDAGALVNETEWLNTTCTLFRRESLPEPVFPEHFNGYSLMEDLALSLTVARTWKLYNVREAKIFHDSQPGIHKNSAFKTSKMELMNRHFIMVKILKRSGFKYEVKLALFELWGIIPLLRSVGGIKKLLPVLGGKFAASVSLFIKRK